MSVLKSVLKSVLRIRWTVFVGVAALLVMALAFRAASGQSAPAGAAPGGATAPGATPAPASVFTYQGQLHDAGAPANGSYDFLFRLFDAPSGGSQLGPEVKVDGVAVRSGVFATALDFGAFFDGSPRWLELAVRVAGAAAYTPLSPRQALTAVPYALFAQAAQTATTASRADAAVLAQTALSAQAAQTATAAYAADVADLAQTALSAQTAQTATTASRADAAVLAQTALSAQAAQTATTAYAADVAAVARVAQNTRETWSLTDVTTDYTTGRLQYGGFYYESGCTMMSCFDPPADAINKVGLGLSPKQVESGAIFVITRTGEYTGSLLLELEVRTFDGAYVHTVSAAPVSLDDLPFGQLVDLPISAVAADRLVSPNQYLAVRVYRSGGRAGDLVVWPAVYAVVGDVQN